MAKMSMTRMGVKLVAAESDKDIEVQLFIDDGYAHTYKRRAARGVTVKRQKKR